MATSDSDRKLLWSRSGGLCALCRCELTAEPAANDPHLVVGEECHIYAQSDDGPRGNGGLTRPERDRYENLILLCRDHHRRIDGQPSAWSAPLLIAKKKEHEEWVSARLKPATQPFRIVFPAAADWSKIRLELCTTGQKLWSTVIHGVYSFRFELPEFDEPEIACEIADFIDEIRDTLEIWDVYPLSHQMRVQFKWTQKLETMHSQGFVVYVGQRMGRMESGSDDPCDWLEAMMCIRPLAECLMENSEAQDSPEEAETVGAE